MSDVTVEDFSRLVSGVYAAAVTPQHWEATIREVHRTMGGLGASLCMADGAIWSIQNTSMPEHAAKSYSEHFCRIDPVLAAVEKGPVGAVRTGNERSRSASSPRPPGAPSRPRLRSVAVPALGSNSNWMGWPHASTTSSS